MWLLEANVDVHLAPLLCEFRISCEPAATRGWKALSNGDLVAAAAAAGFRCLLTRDQLFAQSASQTLSLFPDFAVVLIAVPQRPWPQYRQAFLEAWAASRIRPVSGHLVRWPLLPG